MNSTLTLTHTPAGPFDLALQAAHFGGWPTLPDEPDALVMAFPVEGAGEAAAVVMRQTGAHVSGEVHGPREAWEQALATVSLDADGSGWPDVGERDPQIGELQARYGFLRPTLFHSPYEAAAAFIIGHRISIRQTRAIRGRIAAEHGTPFEIGGATFHAFPTPEQLLGAPALAGVSATKRERLNEIARAASWLTREELRERADALEALQRLPGVGPFFAQGILYRGAGAQDALTSDAVTQHALALRYDGRTDPTESWRPYRMWAVVLLHVWARAERLVPSRRQRAFAAQRR
jgi:DNA-3-methyladenine glycosylase II